MIRVLAHVHMYPPHHNAGAELMLHTLLRHLVSRGHAVQVIADRSPSSSYTYQSIPVIQSSTEASIRASYLWADVAITHLDLTRTAMQYSLSTSTPLVHIVHNDRQLAFHHVTPDAAQLVIFNSSWIARKVAWPGPSIVIPPPVIPSDYATTPGDHITLINLSLSKGARVFYNLAARFPSIPFLGVRGAYSHQLKPYRLLRNLTLIPNTPDVTNEVYSKTKVLLMPSDYESWGRVGVEAAASGIPTIAHPTPGLLESLSYSGVFVDRRNVNDWARALQSVLSNYDHHSALALKRSAELDPTPDLTRFESALKGLV